MRPIILSIFFFASLSGFGQGALGSWEDHLPYHSLKEIVAGEENIFAASDYAIAVYNKTYNEIHKLSTVHGLSECGISTIAYSNSQNTLVIAYYSANIDLYNNDRINNIPDIYNASVAGEKKINKIICDDSFAYIITSFGIVLLDIEKAEIHDTWNPSLSGSVSEVFDMSISGNTVFASTDDGLLYADKNNPALTYFGNWNQVPGISQPGNYNHIASLGESLFISRKATGAEGDSLLLLKQGSLTTISAVSGQEIFSLKTSNNSLIVAKGSEIEIYNSDGILQREIIDLGWGQAESRDAIISDNTLFIADQSNGLIIEHSPDSFESIIIPGPNSTGIADIYSENASVYIAGGLLDGDWDNTWKPFESYIFTDRKWNSFLYNDSWDVLRVRPFPGNSAKIYVSTWGTGVYVLDNTGISDHFNDSNSPLESIIPGSNYIRISGLTFDENKYLWMTQSGVDNSIKVLKPDNSWIIFPNTINAPIIGDIIISKSGKKWITLPGGHGLFILDDMHTPDNFADDIWKKLSVEDQFGKSFNKIYSIAEDLDGNIWIGTDQGPAVFYSAERVFTEDIFCHRIKVPRNDGSGLADYLLSTEIINSISVDGANRKWFGTNSSGLFLVSEDGKELITSYNENNSPLLSNNIVSVDIDDKTGEVWIGTGKGLITVREKATLGNDSFENVYAFPNPVRPEFQGQLTISGLDRNTNVKITDVSGNLVYECTSTGGQASWDLMNYKGVRASTGVYLAFCSTEDGSNSVVIKILIVR